MLALHAADFGGPDHPLLGRPTANVGTISGGDAYNTVAESCAVGVDRRVLPGATEASTVAEMRAKVEGAGIEGLRYASTWTRSARPARWPPTTRG